MRDEAASSCDSVAALRSPIFSSRPPGPPSPTRRGRTSRRVRLEPVGSPLRRLSLLIVGILSSPTPLRRHEQARSRIPICSYTALSGARPGRSTVSRRTFTRQPYILPNPLPGLDLFRVLVLRPRYFSKRPTASFQCETPRSIGTRGSPRSSQYLEVCLQVWTPTREGGERPSLERYIDRRRPRARLIPLVPAAGVRLASRYARPGSRSKTCPGRELCCSRPSTASSEPRHHLLPFAVPSILGELSATSAITLGCARAASPQERVLK